MRLTGPVALVFIVWAAASAQPPGRQEPFVAAGVSYRGALTRDRARSTSDFGAIRARGFNVIRVASSWADLEPSRGQYHLDDLDNLLELAGGSGLRVIVRLETAVPPQWLLERYRDGRHVPADAAERPPAPRACFDHAGVRADVESFVGAVVARAAAHAAFLAVDVGSDLDTGFCLCPHTSRQFREWTSTAFGAGARLPAEQAGDRASFVAEARRDHLAMLGAATAPRGGRLVTSTARVPTLLGALDGPVSQDDWMMSRVVDRYGAEVVPAGRASVTASQIAMALDGVRSAAGANGWLASHATETSAADLRLWTWAALSRGARGVVFGDWRTAGTNTGLAVDESGDRANIAAALARVIGWNPALFAPLRPRTARVAILYDTPSALTRVDLARVHAAFFGRNIPADVVHVGELPAGALGGYSLVATRPGSELPPAAAAALKAFAERGGKVLTIAGAAPTADEMARAAVEVGAAPDARIAGATGVEVRFLESADVLMIVGLNYAGIRQRVTLTFPPDTQEAIWQNMETGAAVNFIAGPDGPTHTHTFGPKDVLVLMIRKNIR